ncbi:hypothetical protein LINGRAHAP2_LOCUS16386 [Linum grandiflorum]
MWTWVAPARNPSTA